MATVAETLARLSASAEEDAAFADNALATAIEALRRVLDRVEDAVNDGLRIPGSATGGSFAESCARDLVSAIHDRDAAYQKQAFVANAARALGEAV